MKTIIYTSIIASLLMCFGFSVSAQAISSFTVPLGIGSTQKTEVIKLQQFLISNGFLHTQATGSYLALTAKAVQAFQTSQGIVPATGYFGSLTMAAANKKIIPIVSAVTAKPDVSVGVQSIKSDTSLTASLVLAGSKSRTITWQTNRYPAGVGVNINLLKKVSSSPASYTLVRQLTADTPNTGLFSWTPQQGENGSNLYIEVTCSTTYKFTQGCNASGQIIPAF